MFRINWVELTNFRSFVGVHKWVLGQGAGLFRITGFSNDNTRLAENGAGKSSLLDSISWCLYGKTTRGLRSTDVVNDDSSSCSVCVNLDVGDENLTIKTVQNPNSLTVNGSIVDRESLAKRLGLNHDAFLYSVIIPQFGDQFLELTPSLKLNLFSQLQELEYWIEKSNQAHTQATEIETHISILLRERESFKGSIDSIQSIIKSLVQKESEWSEKQKSQWKHLQQLNMNAHQKIHTHENRIKELDKKLLFTNLRIKAHESELGKYNEEIKGFDSELSEANKDLSLISYKLSDLKSDEARLKGVGSVCPTCNQEVNQDHLTSELKKAQKELKKLNHEKAEYNQVIEEIKQDRNNIKLEMSGTVIQINQYILEKSNTQENKDRLSNEIRYLNRETKETDLKLEQLKSQKNDFTDLIRSKKAELKDLISKINDKEAEIALLNEELAAVSFWVSGFKQLRLHIVEETLRSLEIEVNNCFEQLGLVNWTIEFDIERETKAGGISKGFNTFITNDKGHKTRIEKMSGGEGQRAILAGTLGLSNLIMERAGLINKSEFYDELSQHLADAGVDDMLACLKERAVSQNKQLWIIDHRSSSFSDFDGSMMVIRDEKGSRLQ